MDKSVVVRLGLIAAGGAAIWYLMRPRDDGDITSNEIDFSSPQPTATQLGQVADAGFFDSDPSDYLAQFDTPYFGNSPSNQSKPNPLDAIIDQLSNAGGGSIGCCAQEAAPAVFVAPSMEYPRVPAYESAPPVYLPAPAPVPLESGKPKRTLNDMVNDINAWHGQLGYGNGNNLNSSITGGRW